MKKILLLGAGGHCKSVIDTLLRCGEFEIIGLVDKPGMLGKEVGSYKVNSTDSEIEALYNKGITKACITVGGNYRIRKKLYERAKQIGFEFPIICDPSAIVSEFACIEEGAFIGKYSVVNAGATIGIATIINTGVIVEHECQIGAFVSISPAATLLGGVCVGDYTMIGSGSLIREKIKIGENCLIGMGSVVVKDIKSYTKAYGNPCREVE